MATAAQIAEKLLTPSIPVLLIGLLVILGAPLLLHIVLSSSSTYTTAPTIILLGHDNAGKTSLLTLLERGTKPAETHTSQASQSVELSATTDAKSKGSFRNHDDSTGTYTKFLLVDTPGHGKLRGVAMGKLSRAERLRGVVFMVDAAALGEQDTLAPTAAYLYDVLLCLQRRASDKAKAKTVVPVLIAANKMDLFTALPASLVKSRLENELGRIRSSRSKGLLDSGVGVDDIGSEEQDSCLGEYASDKFSFQQMMEFGIDVEVIPGSVTTEAADVDRWWWWMANRV
ncbi:hypothetical protein EsDP_00002678 [Epichloe bromicola]|uniref:Signal recognition particle receptor subunit beta n=1 Tax=Epichloe bromicola TaxID=79588 RepID=A0ABQ0CLH7_9HYPO